MFLKYNILEPLGLANIGLSLVSFLEVWLSTNSALGFEMSLSYFHLPVKSIQVLYASPWCQTSLSFVNQSLNGFEESALP